MTNPYHDNLTTLAKRLKPLILKSAITASIEAQITLNAGAGLTGGGTGSNLTIALDTPGTLGASSTNSATGSHTHLIDAASDVSTPAAKILESDASGGLTLNNLLVSGGDLTVGSNILFVDYSGTRIGINTTPDAQFDLDIAGNIRWQGWGVGKMAMTVKDAVMICHYDGAGDPRIDFTGEPNGHFGQVGTPLTNVIYRAGKFGKAVELAAVETNYIKNPSFETNVTDSWSIGSSDSSATRGKHTGEIRTVGLASCVLHRQTAAWAFIASDSGVTTLTLANGESATASADIFVTSGTGTVDLVIHDGTSAVATETTTTTGEYERISATYTNSTGSPVNIHVRVTFTNASNYVWVDAVQLVKLDYDTPYCDGSLSEAHTWSGTAHNSSSSRTAQALSYPTEGINPLRGTIMGWLWRENAGSSLFGVIAHIAGSTAGHIRLLVTDGGALRGEWGTSTAVEGGTVPGRTWTHVAMAYSGSNLYLFINGSLVDSGAMSGFDGLPASMYVGRYAAGGGQLNGLLDDLAFIDRRIEADEMRAIYESDAPIFAETSSFQFRAGGSNVWADEEGLWQRDSAGGAVLGASGVDSKSWGGFTLDAGDIVLGSNTSGKSAINWDRSTGKFGFYGGGGGTAQVEIDTGGTVTAGAGAVTIGVDGIQIFGTAEAAMRIRWLNPSTTGSDLQYGRIYGDWGGGTADSAAIRLSALLQTGDGWPYAQSIMEAYNVVSGVAYQLAITTGGTVNIGGTRAYYTGWQFNSGTAFYTMAERTTTPTAPLVSAGVNMYMKADKIIFQYDDSGTTRYKYLDLTGTGVTWTHTTTAP